MKLAVFADKESRSFLEAFLDPTHEKLCGCEFYQSYDSFIQELPGCRCDAVIVAHKGAMGMQSVRAAKILLHRVPVVWFSDDVGFVEESYRLGCAFFSAETVTEKILSAALERCRAKGED